MLEEIKSLPPLPVSIVRIQEMCMNHDTDIDELSRVIEHDPMLSANILKSVNSPLYGMSKEISSQNLQNYPIVSLLLPFVSCQTIFTYS